MSCFGCFGGTDREPGGTGAPGGVGNGDAEAHRSKSKREVSDRGAGAAPALQPGARVDISKMPSTSSTSARDSSSTKRTSSRRGADESARAPGSGSMKAAGAPKGESPPAVGPETPENPARDLSKGSAGFSRTRSLQRGPAEREHENAAGGGGAAGGAVPLAAQVQDGAMVQGRSIGKITQNLKPPPTKTPAPQFSLSKKRPKDAATEAMLQQETSKLDDLLKSSDLRVFSYQDLRAGTKNFSMDLLIGAGGFGKVYRGSVRLPPLACEAAGAKKDTQEGELVEVAIKRLEAKSLQGHKEWMVEISMLGLVNHPHLVKLLGFCAEGEKRLLVYEFLPCFSLDRYLFGLDPEQPILDWATRLRIALGSARGLAHLHEEMNPPVIYRDFKTSNILLDEDFNPKLSDFGLAREGPSMDRTHVSTQVRGTAGYAAPEYMLTGHLTPKADVWSFGVVLLEMLTGRPSIDPRRPQPEMKLVPLARQQLRQPGDILALMDPNLEEQFPAEAASKVAEVAKWCLQSDPNNRPLMSELVEVLEYLSRPEWEYGAQYEMEE